MEAGIEPFDLSAAYLRKAQADLKAFMEGLAARLEGALSDAVAVKRRRDGLFSGTSHVAAITVTTETSVLTLRVEHGKLHATKAKVVRGVSIGTTQISVPEWLEAVSRDVGTAGAAAEDARRTLHDFLMS